jgi:hypothetical protein
MNDDVSTGSFKDDEDDEDEREKTATPLLGCSSLRCSDDLDDDDDDEDIESTSDSLLS